MVKLYPALTGSKTPPSRYREKREKIGGGGQLPHASDWFGRGQDVCPSGVATRRGAFNLSSPSSMGDEENPH
ncbi:hypothetical protein [Rummeliibacillus sp. SL167]|uniref:hypothetical protein n=1 Tax=Rummeliibacillus sp. SL167 TaxID=2579792 RepID=UPI0011B3F129|nr:hypothetical protein [Rummeliibacillus sp. SL167]